VSRPIKILQRWWWLFFAYVLLVIIVSVSVYIILPPQYSSTTKIFVTSTTNSALANVYDAPYADRAVKTVEVLAEGNELIGTVAQRIGYDVSIIEKSIKIRSIIGTQVIEITVKNQDAQTVSKISQQIPSVLEAQLKAIQKDTDTDAKNQIKISVAEQPMVPEADVATKIKIVCLILLTSGLIGYGLYYLIYLYDRSVKDADDFENVGLNYLGDFGRVEKIDEGIKALLDEENQSALETIREVRSGIFLHDKSSKVISITSLRPKEGKSSFTAALALTLSEIGKKVILVDADLRVPSANKLFSVSVEKGLADYLEDKANKEEILIKSGHDNLWLVPAGKNLSLKASSLLKEGKIRSLINWLQEVGGVDFILIDTPPIEACADSALVAKVSDSVIIVAECDKTSHRDLIKINNVIKKLNTNFLGAVLTKTRSHKKYKYYY
jgi:capsular exopolysaccharide synthesis family protein